MARCILSDWEAETKPFQAIILFDNGNGYHLDMILARNKDFHQENNSIYGL
jgi:hypothetical protein